MAGDAEFDAKESALGYTFDVPTIEAEGIEPETYEVTVAFKQYWSDKCSDILLEGRTVATDVSYNNGEWVSKTFTTKVTDGKLNVQVKSPRRKNADGDPALNYIKVRAVKHTEPQIVTYDSISGVAGEPIYDTDGQLIQAHGGQIQKLTVNGVEKWYWIGEDKTNDYRPCGGIHVYSSADFYNWDDEGVVLKTMESIEEFETDDYFKNLYGGLNDEQKAEIFIDLDRNNCVIERPKMLYNEKTGKYVIWFHADGRTPTNDADYGKAKAGIAVGDSPVGPFRLLGTYKLNYHKGEDGGADPDYDYGYDNWEGRGSVRDMNLFQDDDGTAYVIYSSDGNNTTYISRLNEEYTGLAVDRDEAVEGTDFVRAFGYSREAPAMFKYQGKYYIINSGLTGWAPNPAEYWVADQPFGPWMPKGNPCTEEESDTTYRTQSTCVVPFDPDKGQYIYMGDRWNAGDLRNSRYVWLPIEFGEDGSVALRRHENWKLEEVWEMERDADVTELRKAVKDAEAIEGTQADYTSASWTVYQDALQKARELVGNPGKIQSIVNAAAAALKDAVEKLKMLASVLDDALKDYARPEGAEQDYTKESWDIYQDARKTVQNLLASGGYTEEEVMRAVEALSGAFAGLKKADQEKPVDPEEKVLVNRITVTGTATKITKGESTVLKAEISPSNATNPKVDWSSSDGKVATVSAGGVVTGQGKGIVTITAAATDGSGVKGSYQIAVADTDKTPAPVKDLITKITLKSGSKGVAAGKKVTIKATVKTTGKTADKTLKWTSSNKKYATVNAKGVVTTKKAGAGKTVTITAKATDGSNKSAKIKVKIVKHAVKKISLSCSRKSVKAGRKVTIKAKVTTTGKTANKTLEWSVSNKKYASVNGKGVVSTKKAGAGKRVTITAKATDGTGKKASIKLNLKK